MSHAGESGGASVQAMPSKDPVVRRLIVAAMALGMGIWCIYHAYFSGDPQYTVRPVDGGINDVATYWCNLAGAYILPLIGLLFIGLSVRKLRHRLSMDDAGIHAGSRTVAWSAITEVGADELVKKGFLYVRHSGGELRIDSYDWQKADFQKLVALLEKHVPAEKIKR